MRKVEVVQLLLEYTNEIYFPFLHTICFSKYPTRNSFSGLPLLINLIYLYLYMN